MLLLKHNRHNNFIIAVVICIVEAIHMTYCKKRYFRYRFVTVQIPNVELCTCYLQN